MPSYRRLCQDLQFYYNLLIVRGICGTKDISGTKNVSKLKRIAICIKRMTFDFIDMDLVSPYIALSGETFDLVIKENCEEEYQKS